MTGLAINPVSDSESATMRMLSLVIETVRDVFTSGVVYNSFTKEALNLCRKQWNALVYS